MIPLGNWQETIDELESENHDLTEQNAALNEEVTNLNNQIEALAEEVGSEYYRAEAIQSRANAWFEVAKDLVRARNYWVGSSERWYELFQEEVIAHDELKAALRVLGK